MKERVKDTHPSYGMIRFSRRQGGDGKLFGSSVQHQHTVSVTITEGSVTRDLKCDWYADGKRIVEVEMSPAQFAEALMSMNTIGVPCTIRRRIDENGNFVGIDPCPLENKREQFQKEFEDDLKEIASILDGGSKEINEILDKKSINKGDRETIRSVIDKLKTELKANLPYVLTMFNEQMEKTVTEAKGEVEAFTEHKLRSVGLEKVLEQLQQADQGLIQIVDGQTSAGSLPPPEEE